MTAVKRELRLAIASYSKIIYQYRDDGLSVENSEDVKMSSEEHEQLIAEYVNLIKVAHSRGLRNFLETVYSSGIVDRPIPFND